MWEYKIAHFLLFISIGFSTVAQQKEMNAIRQLYSQYNKELKNLDNYEIKLNTAGSFPIMTIYTNHKGRLLIKTEDKYEMGMEAAEYYYKNDSIQFIFYQSDRILNHWAADTVKYKQEELRFYFNKQQVIKAYAKELWGIEGKNDSIKMANLPNKNVDLQKDKRWMEFNRKQRKYLHLYQNLEHAFDMK